MKSWLRSIEGVPFWRISEDGCVADVSTHLTQIIEAVPPQFISLLPKADPEESWFRLWGLTYPDAAFKDTDFITQNISSRVLRTMLRCLGKCTHHLHAANSMAVRWLGLFNPEYVYCNRGTNGIEGSLSAAAGHSLVTTDMVVHVTGDLSFFYDQNALWNRELQGNLRILLINNGGGGIFSKFEGLKSSPVRESFVMAEHAVNAEGICRQNNVSYRIISEEIDIEEAVDWLIKTESSRPMLLEVVSDKEEDIKTFKEHHPKRPQQP